MEGREQKNQMIKTYMNNTTPQNRWPVVFRHEFLQLVYLRETGFDPRTYNRKGKIYIPPSKSGFCVSCGLILNDGECSLC